MADPPFADFEIWISANAAGDHESRVYPALVVSSPAGSCSSSLSLDVDSPSWRADIESAQRIDTDLATRRAVGQRLYTALFNGNLERLWEQSRGRVDQSANGGMRLRLWIDAPELSALPWELLCDPKDEAFLALSASSVIARYLPVPEPPTLAEHDRLRVLLIVERPPGMPHIPDEEVTRLQAAISAVGSEVELTTLDTPALTELDAALSAQPHIVHYLGHGAPGKLIFAGEAGERLDAVDAERFATLFSGRRSVRLVILTACASAVFTPNATGLFAAVGPALIRARVPAVVAMQYPTVQLDTASNFSRAFYRTLADGLAVDVAVTSGRTTIAGKLLDGRDWSTPVLFLGTRSGRLFNLSTVDRPQIQKEWDAVTAELSDASRAKASLAELARQLRELADAHRRLAAMNDFDRRLREVVTAFMSLRRIVDEAGGDGAALRLSDLIDRWREVHDLRWADLEAFVSHRPDLTNGSWYSALRDAVAIVNADVVRQARRPLAQQTVFELGTALSHATAAARGDLSRVLDEVMRLSERTVGQLPAE